MSNYFKIGDRVIRKSNGSLMTVTAILAADLIWAEWRDEGKVKGAAFHIATIAIRKNAPNRCIVRAPAAKQRLARARTSP